ncbi:Phospholipase A2 isozymes PA3A/PA3B/PA5 [Pseudolycoriella hygida]|uniref:Phospholipase A2 n=1 Tax=Pseudolycoriella hygida TaxID=35572 RepID=A0A9Q0MTF1_9DIPT|nr:Phospholipase A2 isozymes PA3A/PA3B/PA5 [Pseudolycoriella hygida]
MSHQYIRTGNRFSNDSLVMIYYNDQTIAVTELGPAKLLLNCELIEIYDDNEGLKLLQRLSSINKPLEITFKDMVKLMGQCDIVEKQNELNRQPFLSKEQRSVNDEDTSLFPQNPFSLLSGIVPGTKWCGTGDIASSYSDLGSEKTMDRCCRQHDLCPVKIRAYQNRYNLINNSLYSKSHCTCDDMLFSCLKKTNTSAAQVMGSIYFNLVQVPCLQETPAGLRYRKAREGF